MKKIAIIGSGEHAKKIAFEIDKIKDLNLIGFIEENFKIGTIIQKIKNKQIKVIDNLKGLRNKKYEKVSFVIGIGNNYTRFKVVEYINKLNLKLKWNKVISKNAVINGNVQIGDGSVIFSGVVIANESKIGDHCFIGPNSCLEHNNIFGSFSSCGAGVNCGGRVGVGKLSFLGIGTSVKHQVNIKENCIIGGQSLVLKDCQKNSLYFGVPAKKKKKWSLSNKYL